MDKQQPKLFMILLGCKPAGRNTEQHDIFFSIAHSIKELVPQIENFWQGSGKIHIDGWREVNTVDGHAIKIIPVNNPGFTANHKLFFINLGGYKQNEFDEFHYKLLTVSTDKASAIQKAKQTAFYKHTNFKGADSHIDDKYGVDVDDIYEIDDILPAAIKNQFSISIEKQDQAVKEDEINLGYFRLSSF